MVLKMKVIAINNHRSKLKIDALKTKRTIFKTLAAIITGQKKQNNKKPK